MKDRGFSHLPKIYNIPAGISFMDVLAEGLLKQVEKHPENLPNTLILLPTRRSCRSLQEAFLRQSKGKPILLPRMQPFGDIDAEELQISSKGQNSFDIRPALSPLKRQILLAQTISKLPQFSSNPAQDIALASALGQLMDEIYTEDLKLSDLPHLVDREAFAEHWQITLDFLSILSEHWPRVLEEQGVIDAADRRNKLIRALNHHWQTTPPQTPIIAAGSTGSIPATADLLKTIAHLPKGAVILPGLDQYLSNEGWNDVKEGHPQATLKRLLTHLECDRQQVKIWPLLNIKNQNQIREKLLSHVMAPAEQTNQWTKTHFTESEKKDITEAIKNITRYECKTQQEEALIISLILRQTLEDKNKTAALITPDRNLARRVSTTCKRWGITLDDSGGKSLSDSPIGQYLRISAKAMIEGIKPLSLLCLLKHDLAAGNQFKNFRSTVRKLDQQLLRGPAIAVGFESLIKKYHRLHNDSKSFDKPNKDILSLLNHLHSFMHPAVDLFSEGIHDFKKLLRAHIDLCEKLSTSFDKNGEEILWSGEEGESAASFLSELYDNAGNIFPLSGYDYLDILEQLMKNITVRPRYGTHPRLMILGQLEARLIQTDCVILAGLNEGTWPPEPAQDPWMSRPMRQNYGLPLPERGITLAAHDFAQGICSREVFITRSERVDDAPSVPARWLQRLDTFLKAIEINPDLMRGHKHLNYSRKLDDIDNVVAIERPAPIPPLSARPKKLSVTKVETWLKDPYAIYAREILKLKKLNEIEKEFDAAERGNILHEIMERFVKKYPKQLPSNAQDEFIEIAKNIIDQNEYSEIIWNQWKPRLTKLSDWITTHEKQWREQARYGVSEAQGKITVNENINDNFTITARADRIDHINNGTVAIIDYKSGGTYSASKISTSELMQLPLEALILEQNGFSNSGFINKKVGSLSYWKLTGGEEAGKITELNNSDILEKTINVAKEGLIQLIQTFERPETAYLAIPNLDKAPRYNDYAHLERVKEWAALGESGEDSGEAA
ncbi:MAG TPA: double-strand break repair protein AddB [Alphaproteobacteria bacterium]|nr:double-strand break repair protein AddB [Alphaproteobacteria bacterium]